MTADRAAGEKARVASLPWADAWNTSASTASPLGPAALADVIAGTGDRREGGVDTRSEISRGLFQLPTPAGLCRRKRPAKPLGRPGVGTAPSSLRKDSPATADRRMDSPMRPNETPMGAQLQRVETAWEPRWPTCLKGRVQP